LQRALAERYALDGTLTRVAFERDDVYRLDRAPADAWIVRVSPLSESDASLALQNAALHAIAHAAPALPVPRIRASLDGNDVETIVAEEGRFRLRVLSYLPGAPRFRTPRPEATLAMIGRTLARLDDALRDVAPPPPFPLLWDLRGAAQLRPLVRHIADSAQRRLVDDVLAELERDGLARIYALPAQQVIHNDFNPKNVLFDSAG